MADISIKDVIKALENYRDDLQNHTAVIISGNNTSLMRYSDLDIFEKAISLLKEKDVKPNKSEKCSKGSDTINFDVRASTVKIQFKPEMIPIMHFVKLPCNVGDNVYWHNGVGYIHCCKCRGFYILNDGIRIDIGIATPFIDHPALFFSKSEAYAAAKKARDLYDNL